MDINTLEVICFSPTSSGRKVVDNIVKGLSYKEVTFRDITLPENRKNKIEITSNLAIITVPVYFGRVEETAMDFIKEKVSSRGTPVLLIVVYGNRHYDDALIELKVESEKVGFKPFAAAAFVGEHSFSSNKAPLAVKSPNKDHLQVAYNFGIKVKNSLISLDTFGDLQVAGNLTYKKRGKMPIHVTPKHITSKCVDCKICAKACPVGAIDFNQISKVDKSACIYCFACLKKCPQDAKENRNLLLKFSMKKLSKENKDLKKPEIFFSSK